MVLKCPTPIASKRVLMRENGCAHVVACFFDRKNALIAEVDENYSWTTSKGKGRRLIEYGLGQLRDARKNSKNVRSCVRDATGKRQMKKQESPWFMAPRQAIEKNAVVIGVEPQTLCTKEPDALALLN